MSSQQFERFLQLFTVLDQKTKVHGKRDALCSDVSIYDDLPPLEPTSRLT